jgi:hypothetical protein
MVSWERLEANALLPSTPDPANGASASHGGRPAATAPGGMALNAAATAALPAVGSAGITSRAPGVDARSAGTLGARVVATAGTVGVTTGTGTFIPVRVGIPCYSVRPGRRTGRSRANRLLPLRMLTPRR